MNLVTIAIQKAQTYSSLVETTTKLRTANKKLKELDSFKTEFLSIASHQLRTPLAVVKGYAAMLKDGMLGSLNDKQTGAVATVQTAIEQLILLVNHLLDLTRIESGRLQVKPEVVDLNATLTWLIGFMQPKVVEKGLKLTLSSPNDIRVTADLEKLKEVLMNLVDNAVKYTEQGSVTVTVRTQKNLAVVEVKDTGYGLTPEDKARLFEKFATGSASKFVKTTSGLGLYVVRKLMTAMGGTVVAESKGKGKGSTFIVIIPLATDKGV
jgi:signal transduction histidine kinase